MMTKRLRQLQGKMASRDLARHGSGNQMRSTTANSSRHSFWLLFVFAVTVSAMTAVSCAPEGRSSSLKEQTATPDVSEFQRELRKLKTADFEYIFVFRRKDGGRMTGGDKSFIKERSHVSTNRFTLSNDERTVFAGSNFKFREEDLAALKQRFLVDDFSKPEAGPENENVPSPDAGSEGTGGRRVN